MGSATGTRAAALGPRQAALALLLLALLLVAAALAGNWAPAPTLGGGEAGQTDAGLYRAIIERMRSGEGYYRATAAELRLGNYPLRPFVAFRLPTLAWLQSALPPLVQAALRWGLLLGLLAAWTVRLLRERMPPVTSVAALILLVGGAITATQPPTALFHDMWAGLLIALALALRTARRWAGAAACGLAAMLLRETAVAFALAMGMLALFGRRWGEAAAWGAAVALFAIALALHAAAVAEVVRPGDPASPGWQALLGFGFAVRALQMVSVLQLVPGWVAAPLVMLSLAGLIGWRSGWALRGAAALAGYLLMLALFARPDNLYWALMMAPISLVGVALAPALVSDLLRRARSG